MYDYRKEVINIFAYVVGERHYGYIPYSTQWGTDKNKENAKNACSKRVKCLNDNIEHSSMSEASKYYGISICSIRRSILNNRSVICKKDNKSYQFVFA